MEISSDELEKLLEREWIKGYEMAMRDKAEMKKKETSIFSPAPYLTPAPLVPFGTPIEFRC